MPRAQNGAGVSLWSRARAETQTSGRSGELHKNNVVGGPYELLAGGCCCCCCSALPSPAHASGLVWGLFIGTSPPRVAGDGAHSRGAAPIGQIQALIAPARGGSPRQCMGMLIGALRAGEEGSIPSEPTANAGARQGCKRVPLALPCRFWGSPPSKAAPHPAGATAYFGGETQHDSCRGPLTQPIQAGPGRCQTQQRGRTPPKHPKSHPPDRRAGFPA